MRVVSATRVSVITILLGLFLASCTLSSPSSLPSSFSVPPVASGNTVTYGRLAFTVPKSWKIYPGESCAFPGNAVSVGGSGSGICPSGGNPKINIAIWSIKGAGPAVVVGDRVVRKANIHGVVVTLETGYPVQLGSPAMRPGEKIPSQKNDVWPVLAVFQGYNVQFGAMGYTTKQKATLTPVLAVLDSVRPAG